MASIWAEKVSGNTVVLNMWLNTRSLGLVSLQNIKLNYKNGKFSLSSAMGEASAEIYTDDMEDVNYFTAKQKLTVYKKAGSSSKAFTIEKKTTFTISGVVIKNKNIYIKIKVKNQKGKTGWLKLSASSKAFVTNLGTRVAP